MTPRAVRPLVTVLGAAAVVASVSPLRPLVRDARWYAAGIAAVVVVAVAGACCRALRLPAWLTALVQAFLGLGTALARLGLTSGPAGLPAPADVAALPGLLAEGVQTIQRYAAPAPATDGFSMLLAGLVVAAAVLVDILAAGVAAPAAAGFPLLTVYLVAAVNSPRTLAWTAFAAPAALWLLLLVAGTREWAGRTTDGAGSSAGSGAGAPAVLDAAAWAARGVAAIAVVVAVVGQGLLPDQHTRFLTDGLGRGSDQRAGTTVRPGGFGGTLDVARDLQDLSTDPVAQVVVDTRTPAPLAVAQATTYSGGRWLTDPTVAVTDIGSGARDQPSLAADQHMPDEPQAPPGRSRRARVVVQTNVVRPPQMMTPGWPVAVSGNGAIGAKRTDDGLLVTSRTVSKPYTLTYLDHTPTRAELTAPGDAAPPFTGLPGDTTDRRLSLEVDLPRTSTVAATARRVISDPRFTAGLPASRYRDALALQAYLRSDAFEYTLQLPPTAKAADGSPLDPVSSFLATRRGYCVQYSTAMALMARSLGIPARVRLGYLVGTPDLDGRVTIRHSDAHMWPELYLPGSGWTRFEPTPGGRAGDAPAYAPVPSQAPSVVPSTERERPSATPTPTRSSAAPTPGAAPAEDGPNLLVRAAQALGVAALLASVLGARPALVEGRRRRRRATATTPGQVAEVRWAELRERLGDLGVAVPAGVAPADAARAVRADSSLPDGARERVGALLADLERVRYAPPSVQARAAADEPDAADIARDVARTRSWRTRARAALWPSMPHRDA